MCGPIAPRNNADWIYALKIGGTGRSRRALDITNRTYHAMAKEKGTKRSDYAIGATNYASIYMDYAMNNCVELPFAYLDSIYTADCPTMYGEDQSAQLNYLGCQCGQTLLRIYAGAQDSATASMSRARAVWRAMGNEKLRIEQFEGRYGTYAYTVFEHALVNGELERCDSIINLALAAPLTQGAWKHKIAFNQAKLMLQRNDLVAAAAVLKPLREFVDTYRRMGAMPFSVQNSRDLFGVYESMDALELTALLGAGGEELRIRSILGMAAEN